MFFNHPKGRDSIIDVFLSPFYINTIQTSCPWILRYLTTAVVTNKRRKNNLKDLIKIIQQESYEYRDPITEFIESLYVKFDFEGAQRKLKECEEVLSNDFFLVATKMEFIENARYLISETYCRIHLKIDIRLLYIIYIHIYTLCYTLFYVDHTLIIIYSHHICYICSFTHQWFITNIEFRSRRR